ncbi:MAG: chalcone isomerase family protein [Myxococcota bacterium]
MPYVVPLALMGLMLFSPNRAEAKRCAGVTMPDSLEVNGQELQLNGMGLREVSFMNIDVFVAGLYLEEASRSSTSILRSRRLKRIVLHFLRDAPRDRMNDAFREKFEGAGLQSRFQQFTRLMPEEISEGTEIAMTHLPGEGLEVRVGTRVRGVVRGDHFASTFFELFLGSDVEDEDLRDGLLGGDCD